MDITVDVFKKLDGNTNLTPEKRDLLKDIIAEIDAFMKYDISSAFSFDGLSDILDTLKMDDKIDLSDKEIINYSVMRNTISVDKKSFVPNVDHQYLMATKLLLINMMSKPDDEDVYKQNIGLNVGVASLCSKTLFGNEGDYAPLKDEEVIVNLLGTIVGIDTLLEMFVKNNPSILIDRLVGMNFDKRTIIDLINQINWNYDYLNNSKNPVSRLGEIQIILINMLSQKPQLDFDAINDFERNMLSDSNYFNGAYYPNIDQSVSYFNNIKENFYKTNIR